MRIIAWVENVMAVSLLSLAVACGMLQVFARYIVANPMAWTEELARYAFIGTTFFGAIIALREKQHVAMGMLVGKLPDRKRSLAHVVILIICMGIILIMLPGIPRLLQSSSGNRSTIMQLPMSIIYAIWPVSAIFIIIHLVDQILQEWERLIGKRKAVDKNP